MKICYLNHDLNNNTGAGRFGSALLEKMKLVIPDLDYLVLTHDNFLPKKKLQWIIAFPRLRKIFKKYDIIHALDGWPYGAIAAFASIGLKKKLIITAVGTGAIQPLFSFWKKPILIWAYKRSDKIVAVSNNTKKEILKIIPNLRIEVINHGVDFEKFQISNFKFQNLKPYILSVGALKKRKGYDVSIRAFAEISGKLPNLKYVIVGEGPERENLEFKIQNLGLKDKIIIFNRIDEDCLTAFYRNAELFILLSQDINKDIEGFGLVYLEAAAAGLPIIAAEKTSAEDAVLNGKTGLLSPTGDFKGAAVLLEKLLNNSDLRRQFSKEAEIFAKNMSWEKVARQYSFFYHNL